MTTTDQARLDAIADADTLRLVACTEATSWYNVQLHLAADGATSLCRVNASLAARQAFRAVPALRGESR